jgi:hypothetical protein
VTVHAVDDMELLVNADSAGFCTEQPNDFNNESPENRAKVARLAEWGKTYFYKGSYLGDIARQELWDFSEDEIFALEMAYEGFVACQDNRVSLN